MAFCDDHLLRYQKPSHLENVSLDFCHNKISCAEINLQLYFYSNYLMDVCLQTLSRRQFLANFNRQNMQIF